MSEVNIVKNIIDNLKPPPPIVNVVGSMTTNGGFFIKHGPITLNIDEEEMTPLVRAVARSILNQTHIVGSTNKQYTIVESSYLSMMHMFVSKITGFLRTDYAHNTLGATKAHEAAIFFTRVNVADDKENTDLINLMALLGQYVKYIELDRLENYANLLYYVYIKYQDRVPKKRTKKSRKKR